MRYSSSRTSYRIGIMAVFGESGPAKELIEKYRLDAESIYKAVKILSNL